MIELHPRKISFVSNVFTFDGCWGYGYGCWGYGWLFYYCCCWTAQSMRWSASKIGMCWRLVNMLLYVTRNT